jgi:hypothetical protein
MNSALYARDHMRICLDDVHVIGRPFQVAKSKAEIVELLQSYLQDMTGVCHVEKAIVFASWAKGKAGENSDIFMGLVPVIGKSVAAPEVAYLFQAIRF